MDEKEIGSKKIDKILISKYSPENKCNVKDNETLILIAKDQVPNKEISWHFSSLNDQRIKSKYGWVRVVEPFTLDEFFETNKDKIDCNKNKESMLVLFESISNLQEGSPVAVDYSIKSFGKKVPSLRVYKVIFHK
jgi:hypothetical protein